MKESAKYLKRGEIVTFLTIGTVVVLGLVALISPIMLRNKKQITTSKAGEDITYVCRTSSLVWKCDKDGKTADQNAKNAFCGGFASLITDGGNNYDKVIGEWKRQKEINDKYVTGACGSTTSSASQTTPGAGSGGNTTGTGSVNNGCFKFSVDFEPRADGNRVKFYATAKFESAKKGDVQLNGQGVGSNGNHLAGWNRWDSFPGAFVYGPEWTQTWSIGGYEAVSSPNKGSQATVQYTGMHANCDPQSITVNCTVDALSDGHGKVSGQGCNCVGGNCGTSTTTAPSVTRAPTAAGTRPTTVPTSKPTSTPTTVRTFASLTECRNSGCAVLDCEEIGDRYQCVGATPTSQPGKSNITPTVYGQYVPTITISPIISPSQTARPSNTLPPSTVISPNQPPPTLSPVEKPCEEKRCSSPNEAVTYVQKTTEQGVGVANNRYFINETDCKTNQNNFNDVKSWCNQQLRGINFYVSVTYASLDIDLSKDRYIELLVRKPLAHIPFYYFSVNLWEGSPKQIYLWPDISNDELKLRSFKKSIGVALDYENNNYYEKPIFARFCYFPTNKTIRTCVPSAPIIFPTGESPEAHFDINL